MKTKIEDIWQSLENEASFRSGILRRRYAVDVKPNLYVAIKDVEKLRCIVFKVSQFFDNQTIKTDNLREIEIQTIPDDTDNTKKLLLFVLLAPIHVDIFAVLCEDLINAVKDIESENILLNVLKQRFVKWQNLFEKISNIGLSDNEQKGLFGELHFLKILLQNTQNNNALHSWGGMLASPQDFFHQNKWAVEVKTTKINTEKLAISNEFQLDKQGFEHLFLLHISTKTSAQQGQTLNNMVEFLLDFLKNDLILMHLFKQKLLETSYFDLHKNLYENVFYEIDEANFYEVTAEFPRLTPENISIGISNIKYSIGLSKCKNFSISEIQLFEILKKYE